MFACVWKAEIRTEQTIRRRTDCSCKRSCRCNRRTVSCRRLQKRRKRWRTSSKSCGSTAGKNALILSAREEDYKSVGAAAGLAYDQKVGAESAVDINLAKQLNVVTTQLGVKPESIVMNVGSAAVGYGYEYVVSTMDRIKAAALSQSDAMLQMPIITPVSSETWNVKDPWLPRKICRNGDQ